MDCGADMTVTNADEVEELRDSCTTYERKVDFNMTEPDQTLTFDWEQGGEAIIRGDNLTFVLGGPDTTNITLGRLSIQPGVAVFRLGEALRTLVVEDLSISGSEALEDGEKDPCDNLMREIRDSGAIVYMLGCGMKPNIKFDWHSNLEGAGPIMAVQWGFAVGLGLLTSIVLAF